MGDMPTARIESAASYSDTGRETAERKRKSNPAAAPVPLEIEEATEATSEEGATHQLDTLA